MKDDGIGRVSGRVGRKGIKFGVEKGRKGGL